MMDATERELFTTSLRQATGSSTGSELDEALAGIGWAEALDVDPRVAVSALFELQGAAAVTSSSLGRLLVTTMGVDLDADVGVLLPSLGSAAVPGTVDDGCVPVPEVAVRGIGLGDVRRRPTVLVLALRDGKVQSTILDTTALAPRSVGGLDNQLELVSVDTTISTSGPWARVDGDWESAVARARLAIGHELVGAMRTMLDLARVHALERIQFDRPIASFQAVRHRLAETLVAIEAAEAALDGAWLDGSPFTALVAKAVAGQSARTVRKHCQQVLAGIGFTTEHDLHRYVRRTMLLDALLGDARTLTRELGSQLLAAGRLPSILPL